MTVSVLVSEGEIELRSCCVREFSEKQFVEIVGKSGDSFFEKSEI